MRETPMFGDFLDEIDFSTGGELISLFIFCSIVHTLV